MISKTDTGIGSIIRKVSGYPYNHVSVTLDASFRNWVSFARFHYNTPLFAGFLKEPVERFFAKGKLIDIRIFAVDISEERCRQLEELFSRAGEPDNGYLYNYLELLTLSLGISFPIRDTYSCLGFANFLLGTDYRSIRELDRQLPPRLCYEGTLNDLAPDSGDRTDPYFTPLPFTKCLTCGAKTLGAMFCRAFTKSKDPTSVG